MNKQINAALKPLAATYDNFLSFSGSISKDKKHKVNKQINAALKPLAALGLALALAGCNGSTGGTAASGGSETLATVGGTAITRTELNKILEAQSGEQVLPVLIDTQLLIQDGKANNIEVTDAEVAAELDRQKKLDPTLADALAKNPMLVDVINTQVRRNLVTQKLLTKDVKATDAELQKFFNTYRSYYEDPAKVKVGTLVTSTKARADAMSRALKSNGKTFDQLLAEQQKSSDQLAQRSSAGDNFVPVDTLSAVFGPNEAKSIQALSEGGTTEPKSVNIGAGQPIYVLFHVSGKQAATKADFTALKPQLETDYKLAQVAMAEVKKNPQNPPFAETLTRTRDAVQQQQQQMQQNPMSSAPVPPPSLRDVLTLILRPLQQNILTDLRSKGTVKIDDAAYTTVAEQYKAVPTPIPPAAGGADANAAPATGAATNSAAPATNSAMAPATP